MSFRRSRTHLKFGQGFTLVEILVVLVITSLMAGMVVTAVQGVTNTARIARTRSIIAIVDSVIQEQYESYKYRPFPVATPDGSQPIPTGVLSLELLPREAALVRLNMLRDLQRMELPDRVADVRAVNLTTGFATTDLVLPASIQGAASRVRIIDATGRIARDNVKANRISRNVAWYSTASNASAANRQVGPNKLLAYYDRTSTDWTTENQGAECLYLIMATTFIGGAPAIEMIPSSNIGDTDGDGIPEILDAWGRPLGFIRWPVGYEDPDGSIDRNWPDDFDPLRVDFGFNVNVNVGTDPPPPWSIRPLIISAGSDGDFGIHFDPIDNGGNIVAFRYRDGTPMPPGTPMTWPIDASQMGDEIGGRTGVYFFVDPFLRQFRRNNASGFLPGAPLTGSAARTARADNITNFAGASVE